MQHQDIEGLKRELDDLGYLLQKAKEDCLLVPIFKRQLARFVERVEQLGCEPDQRVAAIIKDVTIVEVVSEIEDAAVVIEEQSVKEQPEVLVQTTVLGECLKPAADISKGLSLNDTFRFSRELFGGDKDKMNEALRNISEMKSLVDVTSYLSAHAEWDEENEVMKDFIELLRKYFV